MFTSDIVSILYLIAVCQVILVLFSGIRVVLLSLLAARLKSHDDNFAIRMDGLAGVMIKEGDKNRDRRYNGVTGKPW